MKKIFTISLLLFGLMSFSQIIKAEPMEMNGASSGSGGDALVCIDKETGEVISAAVWDYAEGVIEQGTVIDLGDPNLPWGEKVQIWLTRIQKFDPFLFELLTSYYEGFFKDFDVAPTKPARLIAPMYKGNPVGLRELDDANEAIVFDEEKSTCFKRQVAFQEKKIRSFEAFIKITPRYWNLMDNDNKAGLVIHEILLAYYNLCIKYENKKQTTDDIRYLNRIVAANYIEKISLQQYLMELQDNGFVYFDGPHHWSRSIGNRGTVEVKSLLALHLDDDLKIDKRASGITDVAVGNLYTDFSMLAHGNKLTFRSGTKIHFSREKVVGMLKEDVEFLDFNYGGVFRMIPVSAEEYYRNGYRCGQIQLHVGTSFAAGCLSRDLVVKNPNGVEFTFVKESILRLDRDGKLEAGCIKSDKAWMAESCDIITGEDFYSKGN